MTEIRPDKNNVNKGTVRGAGMVERSLREYGGGRSILIDKDGVVIAGNTTFQAAIDAGLEVEVVQTDGTKLIAVQRTDLALEGEGEAYRMARELSVMDNRASEVGLEWDLEQLQKLAEQDGISLDTMFFEDELEAKLANIVQEFDEEYGEGENFGEGGEGELAHVDEESFWPVFTVSLPHHIMERLKGYIETYKDGDARPHECIEALLDAADVPHWEQQD